jgi:hypothetical protein
MESRFAAMGQGSGEVVAMTAHDQPYWWKGLERPGNERTRERWKAEKLSGIIWYYPEAIVSEMTLRVRSTQMISRLFTATSSVRAAGAGTSTQS